MEMINKTKAVAVVSTVLMVGSICWLMNTQSVNGSLEAGLQKEKLRSEALLSEKLLLEKDIQKFKDDLFELKGQNLNLDNLVKNTTARLEAREADYNRMKRENVSLAEVKRQRKELIALQSDLQNQLQLLKASYSDMEARNSELTSAVAVLEERNRVLTLDLNRAMFAAIDHSQIEAVKGKKEKLTVKARQTKKLIANFEVPITLNNLSFRIIDSDGRVHSQKEGNIIVSTEPSENSYTVSSDPAVQSGKLQKVLMTYVPKQKMKSGIYTVELLNDNLYVGSLKVKLK